MASEVRTEVWFYHLERAPVERILPELLEKTLAKGWRAEVRTGSQEGLDQLNTLLWTYRPDSFLPHGTVKDGSAAEQPVLLTVDQENLNQADVLFLIDGAPPGDVSPYKRCITIFDGRDEEALTQARAFWSQSKADGSPVTYWQQSDRGKWEKKA